MDFRDFPESTHFLPSRGVGVSSAPLWSVRLIFFAAPLSLRRGEIVVVGSELGNLERTRGLEKCRGETGELEMPLAYEIDSWQAASTHMTLEQDSYGSGCFLPTKWGKVNQVCGVRYWALELGEGRDDLYAKSLRLDLSGGHHSV